MEIQRNIYYKIAEWKKETNGTKALLIEGARRIGKSTVAEEFAQNEYKSYIMIDFNKAKKKIKAQIKDSIKKGIAGYHDLDESLDAPLEENLEEE